MDACYRIFYARPLCGDEDEWITVATADEQGVVDWSRDHPGARFDEATLRERLRALPPNDSATNFVLTAGPKGADRREYAVRRDPASPAGAVADLTEGGRTLRRLLGLREPDEAQSEADQISHPERYPWHLVAIWRDGATIPDGEKVQRGFADRGAAEQMKTQLEVQRWPGPATVRYEIRPNPEVTP